ncbi:MAG: hypothetical protein ACK4NY_07425 [Spirosomataceae bacterium]
MTAALLKKRSRIIEQISTMKNKRILDKIDKILAEADIKPITEEDYIQSLEKSVEDYENGRYKTLEEIKARFGR